MNQISEEDKKTVPAELKDHPHVKVFSPYWNSINANRTAFGLLHFGYGQFHRAHRVKHLEALKVLSKSAPPAVLPDALIEMGLDGVVDATRICICFENYMKAVLLTQGFLIHTIDSNPTSHKVLARQQRKRPILLSEVVAITGWHAEKAMPGIAHLPYVQRTTISMSALLSPAYQDVIRLPEEIKEFVTEQNERRNQLHFYDEDGVEASGRIVNRIQRTIEFVNEEIAGLHNRLMDEDSGLSPHLRIDPTMMRAYHMEVRPLG